MPFPNAFIFNALISGTIPETYTAEATKQQDREGIKKTNSNYYTGFLQCKMQV